MMIVSDRLVLNKGKWQLPPILCAAAVVLAACVPAEQPAKDAAEAPQIIADGKSTQKLPPEVALVSLNIAMALVLTIRCDQGLALKPDGMEAQLNAITKKHGDPSKWDLNLITDKQKSEYMADYVKRRNVNKASSASWCAAARRDIAEGTALGKMLAAQ